MLGSLIERGASCLEIVIIFKVPITVAVEAGELRVSVCPRVRKLLPDVFNVAVCGFGWSGPFDGHVEIEGHLTSVEGRSKRALAVDPKDAAAQLGLGKVHLARGETLEAIESLRAAGPAAKPELTKVEERVNLKRLKKSDVNALQKAVSGLVDRTFRARLAEAPALNGVLKVRVTVDSSGSATLVEVLEDSMHDGDVRASAYWNLRDATYPAGRPGRYSFTFNFTNPGA